jgi:hypothetical protein
VGELKADLDCGASATWPFSAHGVTLDHGATINLNGHTIHGNGTGSGISCVTQSDPPVEAPCTVNGPGEISGFEIGVNGAGCTIVARDVALRANRTGVLAVLVCDVDLTNVVASDNAEAGVDVYSLRARGLEVRGNGGPGVVAMRDMDASGVTATGNVQEGVIQTGRGPGSLVDSVVRGNAAASSKLDIAWVGSFRLTNTECGTAAKIRWKRLRGQGDRYRRVVRRRLRCG